MNFNKKTTFLNKVESLGNDSSNALSGLTSTVLSLQEVNNKIDLEVEGAENTIALYQDLIEKSQYDINILKKQKEDNTFVINNIQNIITPN